MKILFLTLYNFASYYQKELCSDLLREFIDNGHLIYTVSPMERKHHQNTRLIDEGRGKILQVKVLNIRQANIVEKTISTLTISELFINAINKYYKNVKFDVVIMTTPPITFYKIVKYIKLKHNAKIYLLLKDIFPQNALDIGLMKKTGISGLMYKFFENIEKKLYEISDYIGCISPANVDFILKNNPSIKKNKVHVSPNSMQLTDLNIKDRTIIRKKYKIPLNKLVYIYGGNLGKPQAIDFVIECMKLSLTKHNDKHFIICGTGTEYYKLERFINQCNPINITLINGLPVNEYEDLLSASDVGLIFLDYRFTIPNIPSRLLSYMEYSKPIFACTDKNTDLGNIIEENNLGWWCESKDPNEFNKIINNISVEDIKNKGINARIFLENNYTTKIGYNIIMKELGE